MQAVVKTWDRELNALHERLGYLFRCPEPRQRSRAYMNGLLSAVERKNGWQLAEWIGETTPDGVQHLLERAQWDADAARDVLRQYAVEQLGGRDAVLIVGETGFVKKGEHSAGVQRQYNATADRIENSQIGVFLCYCGHAGSAFIDRELYVPQAWTDDRARCEAAGIPGSVEFATKSQIARGMLERALDSGVLCGWVTGSEVYGGDRHLRWWLESREQPFVLAVAKNEPLWWQSPISMRADRIADSLPARAWRRLSMGACAKGERLYDWALTPLWRLQIPVEERRFGHYLLVGAASMRNRSMRITSYTPRAARPHCRLWSELRAAGRKSRSALNRLRANAGSISTRCVDGRAGTVTSRWHCWLTPCSSPCGCKEKIAREGSCRLVCRRSVGCCAAF